MPSQKAINGGQSLGFSGTIKLLGLPKTVSGVEEDVVCSLIFVFITSHSTITMSLEKFLFLILEFVIILTFQIKKSHRSDSEVKLMSHNVTGFKK